MLTTDKALSPLRLENNDVKAFKTITEIIIVIAALSLGVATLRIILVQWVSLSQFLRLVLTLGSGLFVVLVGMVALLYFINGFGIPGSITRPYWIEISERLSYRNRCGIHNVDWTDVQSMYFKYTHIYKGDDPLPHDAYNTHLVITLATGQYLEVDIRGAILRGVILSRVNLSGANLRGAYLRVADFQQADLRNVKGLMPAQVKAAKNWKEAFYEPSLLEGLDLPPNHNERLRKLLKEEKLQ